MGLATAGFALSPSLVPGCVFLFLAGFGFLASNTTATTIVQMEVDDAQRGRVMALWSAAFLGMRPFASPVDGAIADSAGFRTAAIIMAVPALIAAVVGPRHSAAAANSGADYPASGAGWRERTQNGRLAVRRNAAVIEVESAETQL